MCGCAIKGRVCRLCEASLRLITASCAHCGGQHARTCGANRASRGCVPAPLSHPAMLSRCCHRSAHLLVAASSSNIPRSHSSQRKARQLRASPGGGGGAGCGAGCTSAVLPSPTTLAGFCSLIGSASIENASCCAANVLLQCRAPLAECRGGAASTAARWRRRLPHAAVLSARGS